MLMLLAIASVAIAVACGSDDDDDVAVAPTARPAATTAAPPVVDARFGGTLKIASVGSVQSFDPLWTTASSTGNVSDTILEPLMDQKDDFSHGKALVDDWEISSDGLTWTWKTLRIAIQST